MTKCAKIGLSVSYWISFMNTVSILPSKSLRFEWSVFAGCFFQAQRRALRAIWDLDRVLANQGMAVCGCMALWYYSSVQLCIGFVVLILVSFELWMAHNLVWFITLPSCLINPYPSTVPPPPIVQAYLWQLVQWMIWKVRFKMCENLLRIVPHYNTMNSTFLDTFK